MNVTSMSLPEAGTGDWRDYRGRCGSGIQKDRNLLNGKSSGLGD
jgi:hypothetical protein